MNILYAYYCVNVYNNYEISTLVCITAFHKHKVYVVVILMIFVVSIFYILYSIITVIASTYKE